MIAKSALAVLTALLAVTNAAPQNQPQSLQDQVSVQTNPDYSGVATPQGLGCAPPVAGECQYGKHIIQTGETLATIAAKHSVSVFELARMNFIQNIDSIQANQELCLPAACVPYVPAPGSSCNDAASIINISLKDFYNRNPSIDAECKNLISGFTYCATIPGVVKI